MTGVQTCALPICFPVTIAAYNEDEIETKSDAKISKVSGSKVEWMEEESYFFRLSKWQKPLLKYYDDNPDFIAPVSRKNEVISFVKSGLKDLSISRTSFKWGIPVPNNNKHVIYVWLDALTNYISALDYFENKNKNQFWPADVHIIGKDIIRFHCVYWPAFLLAAGINHPKKIFAHGWILSGEEKMSKSKGNILNPLEIIENYGLDEIRYYLMKEVIYGEVDSNAKSIIDENQPYYRVQIGAFSTKPSQIPFKSKLKNWQLLCDANGIYRVQVGVYKTKQEALEYQAELKSLGVPQSFVVKIRKIS